MVTREEVGEILDDYLEDEKSEKEAAVSSSSHDQTGGADVPAKTESGQSA